MDLDVGYIDKVQFDALRNLVQTCSRQLSAFISYLKKHPDRRRVKETAIEYEVGTF